MTAALDRSECGGVEPGAADSARSSRDCPVCGTSATLASVFLEERLDHSRMSGFSYASRKEPEFMNHRLVRCATCDLVFVDRPPTQAALGRSYHLSDYDSAEEADDAARAYLDALGPALQASPQWKRVLEIGTGTGIFLAHLQQAGFTTMVGLEPSIAAIEAAPADRRPWIRNSIFIEADLPPASFDLICCFMTMEHVVDPGGLARAAFRLLRPGGAFAVVTHDHQASVNRLLGRRSPIIDVEHMQLFSRTSLLTLFDGAGFRQVSAWSFTNRYSLQYWWRLTPFPRAVKRVVGAALAATRVGRIKMGLNVGNIFAMGMKSD